MEEEADKLLKEMEDAAVSVGSLGKLPLEVGVWNSLGLGLAYPEGIKQ